MAKKTKTETKAPKLAIANNTKLKLVIPAKKATDAYQKTLRSTGTKYKAHGFRKGKAPLKIVEEQIGQQKLIDATLDRILPELYVELIKKEGKKPLTRPEIRVVAADQGKDWELEIQIAEKPEVKLGKYQAVIKKAHKKADEEVKKQSQHIKKHIEEHKKDPKAHAGHAEPKELTNEQKDQIRLRVIFQELIDSIDPQIPELLIKEDVRNQLERLVQQLKQIKMELDDYLKRRGMKFEQLSSQMAIEALSSYQVEFILDAIKADQKITSKEAEFDAYLQQIKSGKTYKQLDPQVQAQVSYSVDRKKIIDFLLSLK